MGAGRELKMKAIALASKVADIVGIPCYGDFDSNSTPVQVEEPKLSPDGKSV